MPCRLRSKLAASTSCFTNSRTRSDLTLKGQCKLHHRLQVISIQDRYLEMDHAGVKFDTQLHFHRKPTKPKPCYSMLGGQGSTTDSAAASYGFIMQSTDTASRNGAQMIASLLCCSDTCDWVLLIQENHPGKFFQSPRWPTACCYQCACHAEGQQVVRRPRRMFTS